MAVIEGLCAAAILLEKGRIAKEGDAPEVVKGYAEGLTTLAGIPMSDRTDRVGLGKSFDLEVSNCLMESGVSRRRPSPDVKRSSGCITAAWSIKTFSTAA